jgi:polyisoprenoid-binding protein YceI
MTRTLRPALLLLLLTALPALAQAPRLYSLAEGSSLTYVLLHKLHEVKGTAKKAEGKARLLPDGTLQAAVRARVADFDSGNGNRDAHMQEAVEANRFPLVDFKGVAPRLAVPARFPTTVPVTLSGKLTFHGVTRDVQVPLRVTFLSAREVRAEGHFPLSLEAHGVERPSLMMVKVEDALRLALDLRLMQEGA